MTSREQLAILVGLRCPRPDARALAATSRNVRDAVTSSVYRSLELNTPRDTERWTINFQRWPVHATHVAHVLVGRGAFMRTTRAAFNMGDRPAQEVVDDNLVLAVRDILRKVDNVSALQFMSVEVYMQSDPNALRFVVPRLKGLRHVLVRGAGLRFAGLLAALPNLATLDVEWVRPKSSRGIREPPLTDIFQRPFSNLHHLTVHAIHTFPPARLHAGQFPQVTLLRITATFVSGWAMRYSFPALQNLALHEAIGIIDVEDWSTHDRITGLRCTPKTLTSLPNIRVARLTLLQPKIRMRRFDARQLARAVCTASPAHLHIHGWSTEMTEALTARLDAYPEHISVTITSAVHVGGIMGYILLALTREATKTIELHLEDDFLKIDSLVVGGMIEAFEEKCRGSRSTATLIVTSERAGRKNVKRVVLRCSYVVEVTSS